MGGGIIYESDSILSISKLELQLLPLQLIIKKLYCTKLQITIYWNDRN